jgi:D-alanyl-D-alanine carboxypeptidase
VGCHTGRDGRLLRCRGAARLALLVIVVAAGACRTAGPVTAPPVDAHGGFGPAQAATIDAMLTSAYPPGGPGAVVIIVRDGRVLFRKACGLADVELQVPMRPDMVFPLASVTKQFTAAAVLLLAEQGRLTLQDDIRKYLPGYPTHGAVITIEHLLTHTSGLSRLSDLGDLRAANNQEAPVTDYLSDWVKDQPLDFQPGERWAYLNWGYTLLGAIVERVSGQTYGEFLKQRVFDPLGMTRTSYGDRRRIITGRVPGYDRQGDTVFNVLPGRSRVLQPAAAGGLLSTVDDLARWDASLYGQRVLARASIERMFTPYRLKNGRLTGYGYGWDIGQYAGHPVQEHAGGIAGYLTHVVRMPADRVYVAILSNSYSFAVPPQATAHRLAALAIGRPLVQPSAVPVAANTLDALVGTYKVSEQSYTISRQGQQLFVQVPGLDKVALVPVAPLAFQTTSFTWRLDFEKDTAGRIVRLHASDWTLNDVAERVDETPLATSAVISIDPMRLDACAGEYELLTGVVLTVQRVGDHLTVRPFGQHAVDVYPASATEFFAKEGDLRYVFVLGTSGEVTGLVRQAAGNRLPARRFK